MKPFDIGQNMPFKHNDIDMLFLAITQVVCAK